MSNLPILHTFILSDEYNFSAKKIKLLAEETAHRRAHDVGWEEITITKIPLIIKKNKTTLHLFQIQGKGEVLEDHDDVVLLKKVLEIPN